MSNLLTATVTRAGVAPLAAPAEMSFPVDGIKIAESGQGSEITFKGKKYLVSETVAALVAASGGTLVQFTVTGKGGRSFSPLQMAFPIESCSVEAISDELVATLSFEGETYTATGQGGAAFSGTAAQLRDKLAEEVFSQTDYKDDMVVKVDPASNTVSVYMRANGAASSTTYIHYRLYHHTSTDADVWTISGIWEVTRTGEEAFTTVKRLVVHDTELLCALQEQGAADFMGGYAHGDEVITATPTLLIDGNEVPLTGAATWHHAGRVSFFQTSKLYRVGSVRTVPLADRKLWLTFADGAMVADQRIEHLASWTVQNGYLCMLAPHRYETYVSGVSENNTSAQISGKYVDNARFTPMDVTARQAAADAANDYVRPSPRITAVKLWGTYGVECEMEVLATSADILKDVFFMQRTNHAYNKAYIGFIAGYSGAQAVTSATKWQIKTRLYFRSKN